MSWWPEVRLQSDGLASEPASATCEPHMAVQNCQSKVCYMPTRLDFKILLLGICHRKIMRRAQDGGTKQHPVASFREEKMD